MRPGMILWVAIVGQAFGPGSEGCGGLSSDAVDFGGRVLHPATLRRSELAGLGCTTRVGGAGWGVRGAARLRGGGIDGEQETAVKQDGGDQDAHDPDERAMDVWDVASGPVKFPPGFFERPGAEDLTGLDAEYTMFRHRRTGAAVEIVHDDDDDDIPGFFRMLSAFIFKTKASSKITANFAEDCPGYVVFANAHCTGDFFKATNLYHSLAADPGAQPFSEAALLGGNWTVESEDDGAGRRVLAHSASNWTLRTSGPYLILHHRVCLGAQVPPPSRRLAVLRCRAFTPGSCC